MSRTIACAVVLGLLCVPTLAATLPGTDINACPTVSASVFGTPLNAKAIVSYKDTAGVSAPDLASNTVSVSTLVAGTPKKGNKVTTFVAPPPDTKPYFTIGRSLFGGASLVGKSVKLAGKITSANGAFYIDDGSALRNKTTSQPVSVMLRTDLLSLVPVIGSAVTIQGVVRMEANGQPSLLPFTNCAIATLP